MTDSSDLEQLDASTCVGGDGSNDAASSNSNSKAETAHMLLKQLGIPKQYASDLRTARAYISNLGESAAPLPKPQTPRHLIVHRVGEGVIYLDKPVWSDGEDDSSGSLGSKARIFDVGAYLSQHPEVAFIVCRDYGTNLSKIDAGDIDADGNIDAFPCSETIIPAEKHLALAIRRLKAFASQGFSSRAEPLDVEDGDLKDFSNDWLVETNDIVLSFPYFPFYHCRESDLEAIFKCTEPLEKVQLERVVAYIIDNYEQEYEEVRTLTNNGRITIAYLDYLFRPGIIVVEGKGEDARGYMCESWLERDETSTANSTSIEYSVSAWHWDVGRQFTKSRSRLRLKGINPGDKSGRRIEDLELRPLNYVDTKTLERLQRRGEWIWKCRHRQLVTCRGKSIEAFQRASGERYMVDLNTYYELHPERISRPGRGFEPMDSETIAQEDPPDRSFVYITAAFTRGFNLKTKKWCDLCVDRFEEVEWNTNAFSSLVLNQTTKRLIQALISNQVEAKMSTDIISGKGNGLTMLLHGGPGTGKTLTAESVAEIAQRPLYPVTCGDMGTEPRDVEKYLESVLHLSKIWGCVVLLDEADVFLEQRSFDDLKRNALVSVFLRVLEYYDGILILTSNRVGNFDEAFRSRIQLAIHYASLTEHQRTKIWGNFLGRLKELNEEGVDFADLGDNIENLAKHEMNGREIRNFITTSRPLGAETVKQPKVRIELQGGRGYHSDI